MTTEPPPADSPLRQPEDRVFVLLVIVVTLAFGWVLLAFWGAILWGVTAAVVFAPLNRRLVRATGQRRTLAAALTVVAVVLIVILPLTGVIASLAQEATVVYGKIQSGELNFVRLFQDVLRVLPGWATGMLEQYGLASLGAVQERLAAGLLAGSRVLAAQALNVGQVTFEFVVSLFVMLYLLFFLLRDATPLRARLRAAIPLRIDQKTELFSKFAIVVRAMVKGNILVAVLQGALGGLMFWALGIAAPLLWGTVMAFLSLLPALGAGLIWIPVAIYLLAVGSIVKGVILIAFGAGVIGLVDNLLRPILVGKDTRMPDYVVLISTLGGIEAFGINGFVLGPVIAAMFIAVWDIFSEERAAADAPPRDAAPPI